MKKVRYIRKLMIVAILFIILLKGFIFTTKVDNLFLQDKIYSFLQSKNNRRETFIAAVDLHYGDPSNTCVYFISEVLRRNDYEVPENICNTSQILDFLEEKGWKRNYDYKSLKSGDICFTTDAYGDKYGIPTHTYVFMGWIDEGKYDYAYICDNQVKDYDDKVYHIRNINITDNINGLVKDQFSFFLEK